MIPSFKITAIWLCALNYLCPPNSLAEEQSDGGVRYNWIEVVEQDGQIEIDSIGCNPYDCIVYLAGRGGMDLKMSQKARSALLAARDFKGGFSRDNLLDLLAQMVLHYNSAIAAEGKKIHLEFHSDTPRTNPNTVVVVLENERN